MEKPHRISSYLLCVLIIGFFIGPPLFHLGYRAITTADQKDRKKKAYFELSEAELYITEKGKIQGSRNERIRIYYWFHSRGWDLDEGDEESRFAESWRKLFRYWNESAA